MEYPGQVGFRAHGDGHGSFLPVRVSDPTGSWMVNVCPGNRMSGMTVAHEYLPWQTTLFTTRSTCATPALR
ncbi:hypothetical protein GCM10022243_54030 [Saccharothrix violaceirubra]